MGLKGKRTINVEISSILDRLVEGATSDKTSLNEILRLCMRLGHLLKNDELVEWAHAEATGYKNIEELPDYRILPTEIRADFSGPFGSGLRNAHIPKTIIDDKHKFLYTHYLTEPIAELEQLARQSEKDGGSLKSYWPADALALYQQKELYEGMVLMSAWRPMTSSQITGVLDNIRTRVLQFVMTIQDEMGITGKGPDTGDVSAPEPEKVQQIVNAQIYGGNVSLGNSGKITQNSIQVGPGDLTSLKTYLKSLGLTNELLEELEKSLNADVDAKEHPGPRTSQWLSKVMILIGKGSLAVTNNTAGSLIASALMQYLGIQQ